MNNVVTLLPKSAPSQTENTTEVAKPVPEFITMSDIDKMNDDELDAMIAAIRVRRMQSHAIYKKHVEERGLIAEAKIKVKVDKKCEQIIRKLDTIDKQMDDLERYVAELRGLRLQAGLALI